MKIVSVITVVILLFFVVSCGLSNHYVQSTSSMSPTINVGDHFVTFDLNNEALNPLERFDIVTYKPQPIAQKPSDEKSKYAHRIIGLEGEAVEIKNGRVFINDVELDEPFYKVVDKSSFAKILIPKGEFFLLGDNRPNSADSRYWVKPTIKRQDIYGKVSTIISKEDYDNGKRW